MPPRLPSLHVEFPPPLREALRVAAFHERVSVSEVIRRACAAYVEKVNETASKEIAK